MAPSRLPLDGCGGGAAVAESVEQRLRRLTAYDPISDRIGVLFVDITLLTVRERQLEVLVIKRTEYPAKGFWSLPGGFVGIGEELTAAAHRILNAKAHLKHPYLEQLFTFGQPNRDPRMPRTGGRGTGPWSRS